MLLDQYMKSYVCKLLSGTYYLVTDMAFPCGTNQIAGCIKVPMKDGACLPLNLVEHENIMWHDPQVLSFWQLMTWQLLLKQPDAMPLEYKTMTLLLSNYWRTILQWWEQVSPEWLATGEKVLTHTYQCCINILEVACMFELMNMNRSQTSMALIHSRWLQLMTIWLKCAEEEIIWLNIKVPCLATYICDKDAYLRVKEVELTLSNPALAHQVSVHQMEWGYFNAHHLKVLQKIHHLTGYTGPIKFGTHIAENPTTYHCYHAGGGSGSFSFSTYYRCNSLS